MKHVVTLTTSNPSHEHVALRRKQSTTNFMVEAADEQTAILRATAHFRRLGHYIHEAKVFKKKDEQLSEAAVALKQPFDKETNMGSVVPGTSKNAGTTQQQVSSNKYFDVTTGKEVTRTTQSDAEWEKEKREANLRNLQATDKPVETVFPELNLIGGISKLPSTISSLLAKRVPKTVPGTRPAPQRRTPSKPGQFPGMPAPGPRRERPATPKPSEKPTEKPKVEPAVPVPATPAPSREPVVLPPSTPKPTEKPKVEPKRVPEKPTPAAPPQTKPEPQPKQAPAEKKKPGQQTSPQVTPSALPRSAGDPRPKTSGAMGGRPLGRRPFILPSLGLGGRGDQDIGTLGQYRGLFPLYPFSEFGAIQENKAAMNAVGRVLAKRKKNDKDNAEAEKNKINMEPTLSGNKI